MRLLLLNPNTSADLTDRMLATARAVLPAGVALHAATAPRGFPYISNRSEALIAGAVTMEMLATQAPAPDAAIIAAFGDPGTRAARDLFPFPVIGVAEAAMHSAALLGDRFAIVAFTPAMRAWYLDCVHEVGLERRFAGFRAPTRGFDGVGTVQSDLRGALLDCISACQRRDGADVVIMAGAPLAGFADSVRAATDVALVDPVAAAVQQAVAVARIAPRAPEGRHDGLPPEGPRARHDPKPSTGLEPALAAWFAGDRPAAVPADPARPGHTARSAP